MTPESNLAEFKQQTASVLAQLYTSFPKKLNFDTSEITEDGFDFLMNGGFVRSNVRKSLQAVRFGDVQLTERTISALRQSEQNAGGRPLGDALVEAIGGTSDREKTVLVDLVCRRLFDI